MKRDLVCEKCIPHHRDRVPCRYPGEHTKIVEGKSNNDFQCDACGMKIRKGEKAGAFSVWADYGGIPYAPWESDYLEVA